MLKFEYKKVKILILTNHLNGTDGWSSYSLNFIKELRKLRHEVLVLTTRGTKNYEIREAPILDEPLKYLANPIRSYLTALKVNKIIWQFSPDIIHFMVEPYASTLPFLRFNKNCKTILTVHGTYSVIPALFKDVEFFKNIFSSHLSKKYYNRVDKIIAVSNYTRNYLLSYYKELKTKIRVITNGLDLETHKIIDLNNKPGNQIKKILFVGAIKKRKGILESIEALKFYRDNFRDNFIYELVGQFNPDDNYYQQAIKSIKAYKLEDRIFFMGEVTQNDLEKYYSDADLFLMLPITCNGFEGFGLVYLEANSKGVVCIGSKNCGAEEAILEDKTGYIVNPFNPQEIAKKIDYTLNKKTIDLQDCIEWATQNDIRIKTKELEKIYNENLMCNRPV